MIFGPEQKRGDLGSFEGCVRPFRVVLVVDGDEGVGLDDLDEFSPQGGDPRDRLGPLGFQPPQTVAAGLARIPGISLAVVH